MAKREKYRKSSIIKSECKTKKEKVSKTDDVWSTTYDVITLVLGIGIAIYLGYHYAIYSKQLHENDMWFSNIKQVEREISFRTESGLYFSYYKQLVLASSLSQGLYELTHDNTTEHLRTINILERFNIYQEVILGILYRTLPQSFKDSIEYVYFYINTVFGLHGMYMVAIYITTWMLSGSFIAGILSVAFFVFNRFDMTRLFFTIPLRESFSLPFIYVQISALTFYFKKDQQVGQKRFALMVISLSTLLFTITWQFAQFVLLLEAFALFGMYALDFATSEKVKPLFFIILGNLATVCCLQFGNDMLYTSLVGSFSIAAILVMSFKKSERGFIGSILVLVFRVIVVLGLAFLLNFAIKKITRVDSDEHVFKFVSAKLGYGTATKKDFDASLYLCGDGFQYLPMNTFERLTDGVVFPVYVASAVSLLLALAFSYCQKLRGTSSLLDDYPALVFNVILNLFFGGMALTTLRMKFLWMPHMCIIAASIISHQETWKACLSSIHFTGFLNYAVRHSIPIVILSVVLYKKLEGASEELKELREFHDPDTVELMEWIKSSTEPGVSFTGSMQLMAGVKLCTDRSITNHPHYENKFLRQRTKEVYQIYARKKPREVHEILRRHGTDYIILENSICYSRQQQGCRLIDILDLDNGHNSDNHSPPRFCDAIKHNSMFKKYFKKVFENRTFYLYKLL